ncbi:682_t:CDS:1 [Acaulospora colombiana]|uniref:682_t:CDS:1 n=1 Tax=Acaulospora colombiana TaxID=27376 RepID=A0ACA9L0R3_9GLOM|nr:682_t:CDS:1 [Acaulospora colombiana]
MTRAVWKIFTHSREEQLLIKYRNIFDQPMESILQIILQLEKNYNENSSQFESLSKDLLNKESLKIPASLTIPPLVEIQMLESLALIATSVTSNEKQFLKGSSIYNSNASSRLPSPPLVNEKEELNTHVDYN